MPRSPSSCLVNPEQPGTQMARMPRSETNLSDILGIQPLWMPRLLRERAAILRFPEHPRESDAQDVRIIGWYAQASGAARKAREGEDARDPGWHPRVSWAAELRMLRTPRMSKSILGILGFRLPRMPRLHNHLLGILSIGCPGCLGC